MVTMSTSWNSDYTLSEPKVTLLFYSSEHTFMHMIEKCICQKNIQKKHVLSFLFIAWFIGEERLKLIKVV